MEEYLNTDIKTEQQISLIAQDLETVAHAGFTGEDVGGGRAFLLVVKSLLTEGVSTTVDEKREDHFF